MNKPDIPSFCGICDFYKQGKCPYGDRQQEMVLGGVCYQPRISGADLSFLSTTNVTVFSISQGKLVSYSRDSPELASALTALALKQKELRPAVSPKLTVHVGVRPVSGVPGCGVAQGMRDRLMASGME